MQDIMVRNVRSSLLVLLGAVTLRPADRVRERREPAAGARDRAQARDRDPRGDGRRARPHHPPAAHRKRRCCRWSAASLGLVLGIAGIRALLAVNPGNIPRIGVDGSGVSVDWRVLAFTAAVSLVTGLVFGLFPALQASRADLNTTLKESSGRSGSGFRQNKARVAAGRHRDGAGAGAAGRRRAVHPHVRRAARRQPGLRRAHVLTMRMSLTRAAVREDGRRRAVDARRRRTAERAARRRGRGRRRAACRSKADSGCRSSSKAGRSTGRRTAAADSRRSRRATSTSSRFRSCAAARSPIGTPAARPAWSIINQAMAKQYWPNGDPLADRIVDRQGRRAGVRGAAGAPDRRHRRRRPRRRAEPAIRSRAMYVPWAQMPDAHSANLLGITPLALGRADARRAARAERRDSAGAARGERRPAGGADRVDGRDRRAVDGALRLQHDAADDVRLRRRCCWRRSASTA